MCNFCWPFYSQFCTVWYVGVLIVLQLQDTICIYICAWPRVKHVTRSFYIWMQTFLVLHVNNVWLLPVYSKFKIVLYFWPKHMWGQILRLINIYLYFITICIFFAHASVCVWRMLTLVRESCDPCWYSESSSFLHSWAWRDDESWLSSGIAIWSFLCSFLYTLNAGVSNTIMWYSIIQSQQRASHYISSFLCPCHPLSVSRVIPWSFI